MSSAPSQNGSTSPLRAALVAVAASGVIAAATVIALPLVWTGGVPVLVAAAILAVTLATGVAASALAPLLRSYGRISVELGDLRRHLEPAALQPIAGSDEAAIGWNQLVEVVGRRAALEGIESRLRETIGGLKRRESDQVLDSLPDGVAVTAGEVLRYSNRAFGTLLGIENEETTGRPITSFLGLHDEQAAELEIADRPIVVEIARGDMTADGVLRVSRLPLLGESGTATHVWTVRDVTQHKLGEEMRDTFVSSATHELRTPLANIKAYSEMLATLDVADLERQKEFCNIIDTEVTRLGRFVDDLLSIDQMESGALSLVRGDTDVERLVREVCEKVRPQMNAKDIRFETTFPQKFPKLQLDKDKFAAALVNLLGNAAKYTPDGGAVRLVVEISDEKLRFHVEDTGIGIAEEELPRVFEKFFRSEDDRVRDLSGNGLGLSFTREVVRLHGGDVTVHSELNKGTRFTLTMAT